MSFLDKLGLKIKKKNQYCIGVGFPKCGTTSIFHLLAESHCFNIYGAKESTFLNKEKFSLNEYNAIFGNKLKNISGQKGLPFMEITPHYVYNDNFYKNIQQIPKKDLFAFLVVRNPILRCISHYIHDLRLGTCSFPASELFDLKNIDSTYCVHSRLGDYVERFAAADIGKVYSLERINGTNAQDLKKDIYHRFFDSSLDEATFMGKFKNPLPKNNGTGFVPYVTYFPQAKTVKADGKSIKVPENSYLIERVLVPYGYQTELITKCTDAKKASLDRLRQLNGKQIVFSKNDIEQAAEKLFSRDMEILSKHGINFDEYDDVTYGYVESRLEV